MLIHFLTIRSMSTDLSLSSRVGISHLHPLHRWVAWADGAEQERLREYHRRAIGDDLHHRWTDAPLAE